MKNNNNNLSKGWRKVKLGELVVPRGSVSGPFGSDIKSIYFRTKGTPIIRGNNLTMNIDKGRYIDDNYIFLDPKRFEDLKKAEALPEDIIITARGTIGQTGIIPKNSKYPRYIISANQLRFRIDKQKADPLFVYYQLSSKYMTQQMQNYSVNVGVPNFNLTAARNLELLIPKDPNEQKRIADILSAFDDKIEVNNKIIKTLEEMAQEVFKEKFNSEKLKQEKWEIKNIEDVFVFEKGIEPGSKYYSEKKQKGYIPFYRVRDLDKQSSVDVCIPEEIAKGKICKEKDVLLSLDATVGRVKIGCNGAFSSGIRKVYSKDGFIKNSFIYFWLKTPYVQNTILEHSSGTTILHAGQSIKYLKFPFNKEVIEKIQSKVEPMFFKILQILKENQTLATLRDSLLPKLMSGEIRI